MHSVMQEGLLPYIIKKPFPCIYILMLPIANFNNYSKQLVDIVWLRLQPNYAPWAKFLNIILLRPSTMISKKNGISLESIYIS